MNGTPRISFIIPFYASHNKLDECVQSLVRHCDVPFEIIIVDDGNVAYDFGSVEQEPTVQIVRNEQNRGPAYRRNQGIKLAQGTYVQFIDSDDTLIGDVSAYFEAVAKAGTANPDVITGLLERRQVIRRLAENLPRITNLERETVLVKLSGFTAHLYAREFLLENAIEFPTDLRSAEDTVFLMRVLARAKAVLLTEITHYSYRLMDNSLSKPSGQSDSPNVSGNAFELRFMVAAGYVLDALQAHPTAQVVRGSIMFKYGIKGMKRIAATEGRKPFGDASSVLALLIKRAGILCSEADQIRSETGVYWDDQLRQVAKDIQENNIAAVWAVVVEADLRLF